MRSALETYEIYRGLFKSLRLKYNVSGSKGRSVAYQSAKARLWARCERECVRPINSRGVR